MPTAKASIDVAIDCIMISGNFIFFSVIILHFGYAKSLKPSISILPETINNNANEIFGKINSKYFKDSKYIGWKPDGLPYIELQDIMDPP